MAATAKLMRLSKPLDLGFSRQVLSNISSFSSTGSKSKTLMCLSKVGLSSDIPPIGSGGRRPVVVKTVAGASACLLNFEQKIDGKMVDLAMLLRSISNAILSLWVRFIAKQRPRRFHIQMLIEKFIMDCRFFALLAIAGSLLGSVLCFVEGWFLILGSYFQYFHALSQMSEQGHVMLLLIEAIDMFLVGTAMLIFGMALHIMFVGTITKNLINEGTLSNNFNLEKLKSWIKMQSVMQAKSKIGHVIIMILQVEVLEKFKGIAITNGLDLACFAGVVFLSSASIFLLSRIAVSPAEGQFNNKKLKQTLQPM